MLVERHIDPTQESDMVTYTFAVEFVRDSTPLGFEAHVKKVAGRKPSNVGNVLCRGMASITFVFTSLEQATFTRRTLCRDDEVTAWSDVTKIVSGR